MEGVGSCGKGGKYVSLEGSRQPLPLHCADDAGTLSSKDESLLVNPNAANLVSWKVRQQIFTLVVPEST